MYVVPRNFRNDGSILAVEATKTVQAAVRRFRGARVS